MNDFTRTQAHTGTMDMSVDAGLRAFMLGVYNKLAIGLVVSGLLALLTSQYAPVRDLLFTVQQTPQGMMIGLTMIGMVVQFAPLVLLFGSMFFMRNPSASGASLLYWAVVASIGASLGLVFLLYTATSVATTFFVTAAAFGGLSLFGYTTKKDLSAIGSFLIMGVIGLIIAMVVNMFLQSSALMYAISAAGVLIFSGLIAWDTQRLKATYYALGGDKAGMAVATSFGALSLYINFINLFQFLLMFLGNRN